MESFVHTAQIFPFVKVKIEGEEKDSINSSKITGVFQNNMYHSVYVDEEFKDKKMKFKLFFPEKDFLVFEVYDAKYKEL